MQKLASLFSDNVFFLLDVWPDLSQCISAFARGDVAKTLVCNCQLSINNNFFVLNLTCDHCPRQWKTCKTRTVWGHPSDTGVSHLITASNIKKCKSPQHKGLNTSCLIPLILFIQLMLHLIYLLTPRLYSLDLFKTLNHKLQFQSFLLTLYPWLGQEQAQASKQSFRPGSHLDPYFLFCHNLHRCFIHGS